MRMAWYKPGHEITPRDIADDIARRLKAIDDHDLKGLVKFWQEEVDRDTGNGLPARKLFEYATELERRETTQRKLDGKDRPLTLEDM